MNPPAVLDWVGPLEGLTTLALTLFHLGLVVAALGVIPGNRKPSSAMAWLLLIVLIPYVGFLIFLLIGSDKLGGRRRAQQVEVNERIRTGAQKMTREHGYQPAYPESVVTLNQHLGALPALTGNDATLFTDYRESIAAMTAEVERARRFVHVQFYITAWDEVTGPFFEALERATERGVVVRLLFDHLGSRGIPGYQTMLERLKATRIQWHPMLPVGLRKGHRRRPDLRNHRKILVVDGMVAVMGSQNLIEPGYNKDKNHQAGREWVELTCRLRGPVVTALNVVFATDWYSESGELLTQETVAPPSDLPSDVPSDLPSDLPSDSDGSLVCQVIPSGPGFVTENNLRAFTTLIYSAQRRVSLTSPYFVPDESLLYAVTTAAQRGVDVELFVSEEGDQFMVYHAQCSYYRALLEAGVRIYLYPSPAVLHAKHFSIDDDVAVIGSSNMDMRSFALNYEVSTMFLGAELVARVREVEDHYRQVSRELTLDEWRARPAPARYVDNVMRLTAALQ